MSSSTDSLAPRLSVAWQGLRQVHMLQSLPDERLAQLAARCRWLRLEPQQTLAGPYVDQRLYMLVQGALRLTGHTASGRSLVMGDIAPGLFFGRLSVYPGQAFFPLAVEATRPSLVASLARDDVEALLMGEPGVLRSVIERLSELTAVLAHRVVGLATLSVRARLHAQLLELGEQAGGGQDGEALLSPAPTQSDLASRLGTSREEVAREMSRLMRLGLLRREGRDLRICRMEGLRVLLEEAL